MKILKQKPEPTGTISIRGTGTLSRPSSTQLRTQCNGFNFNATLAGV